MVIKRMRWKAIFQNTKKENNNQQRYGLRCFQIPLPVKVLAVFESEFFELVKDIKFRKVIDIKDFYLSIQEELLNKGLRFDQEYIDISGKVRAIICQACKSLFFDTKDTWIKKQSGLSDVTMGAWTVRSMRISRYIYVIFYIRKT